MTAYTPDPADVELVELALCKTRFWLVAMERSVLCEDDLSESARAVLAALATAGRLPDEIEWGWQGYSEQEPQRGMPLRDEATARSVVEAHPGTKLVRRLVGPWEELT